MADVTSPNRLDGVFAIGAVLRRRWLARDGLAQRGRWFAIACFVLAFAQTFCVSRRGVRDEVAHCSVVYGYRDCSLWCADADGHLP